MSYSIDESVLKLIYQYRHSPNLIKLLKVFLLEYETLSKEAEKFYTRLDIDASYGRQLDGIGEIVGRPRPLTEQIDPNDVFSFAGGPGKGFSGIGRLDQGGRFVGIDGLFVGRMTDASYRVLLRSQIYANYADSTVDSLSEYIKFVLGNPGNISVGPGCVDVVYPRPVSAAELQIIESTLPIAAGIRLRTSAYSLGLDAFCFEGGSGFGFDGLAIVEDTASLSLVFSPSYTETTPEASLLLDFVGDSYSIIYQYYAVSDRIWYPKTKTEAESLALYGDPSFVQDGDGFAGLT